MLKEELLGCDTSGRIDSQLQSLVGPSLEGRGDIGEERRCQESGMKALFPDHALEMFQPGCLRIFSDQLADPLGDRQGATGGGDFWVPPPVSTIGGNGKRGLPRPVLGHLFDRLLDLRILPSIEKVSLGRLAGEREHHFMNELDTGDRAFDIDDDRLNLQRERRLLGHRGITGATRLEPST